MDPSGPVMHDDLLAELRRLRADIAVLHVEVTRRSRYWLPLMQGAGLLLAAGLLILLARIA